jgi:hypothetical protein
VEIKHGKNLIPKWLASAMEQAEKHHTPYVLPLLVLHQKQQLYLDSLVVLCLSDFRDWFGDGQM